MAAYRPISRTNDIRFRVVSPQPLPRDPEPQAEPEPDNRVEPEEVERLLADRAALVEARVRAELEPRIRELQQAIPNVRSVGTALARARCSAVRHARRDVCELAVSLARRIVGEALDVRPELFLPIVDRALEPVGESDIVAIRVPSARAAVIRRHLPEELRNRVVPDMTLTDHVVVDTDGARVEAGVALALDGLSDAVREWAEASD